MLDGYAGVSDCTHICLGSKLENCEQLAASVCIRFFSRFPASCALKLVAVSADCAQQSGTDQQGAPH